MQLSPQSMPFSVLSRFLLVLFFISPQPIFTRKVFLLDSTEEANLNWQKNSPVDEDDGWTEETFTDPRTGANQRSYIVCDFSRRHSENWLRTPFIERHNANRLAVQLSFTMRDCRNYPRDVLTCKETFSVYYLETDTSLNDTTPEDWSRTRYRLVDRIAADSRNLGYGEGATVNNETRYIPITKRGVYFAFLDEGACISLLSVKVYYEVCDEQLVNFARYPETPAGAEMASVTKVLGQCVDNAKPFPLGGPAPAYYCRSDGRWDLLDGGCLCEPGYQPIDHGCVACAVGMYKLNYGRDSCIYCPEHSSSQKLATTQCKCDPGYFRAPGEGATTPCTRPPSRPSKVRVLHRSSTSAVLTWDLPNDTGGRTDLVYRVICSESISSPQTLVQNSVGSGHKCPSTGMTFDPPEAASGSPGTNWTRVLVTNLASSMEYTFLITAENGVSTVAGTAAKYAAVAFRTDAQAAFHIEAFRIEAVTESSVTLTWQNGYVVQLQHQQQSGAGYGSGQNQGDILPNQGEQQLKESEERFGWRAWSSEAAQSLLRDTADFYEVGYFERGQESNVTIVRTTQTELTVHGLNALTEYGFQIRARSLPHDSQTGSWSDPRWARTQGTQARQAELASDTRAMVVVLIAVLCVTIFMALVAVAWYAFRNRHNYPCSSRKQLSDSDSLEYRNGVASPLITPFLSSRTGLKIFPDSSDDPVSTYEDVKMVIYSQLPALPEIPCDNILIEEILIKRDTSQVCRGTLRCPGQTDEAVLITTLSETGLTSEEALRKSFFREAAILAQLSHPNVIRLFGVVSKTDPAMIVTEYLSNRSLDAFLRLNHGRLNTTQLLCMIRGIACGMQHLAELGVVHCDLSAKSVHVDAELNCKIAQFGLANWRQGLGGFLSLDSHYSLSSGKVPVRWSAPEAIRSQKFTTPSDVWSFGVVMWEIVSYGQQPYGDWPSHTVHQAVEGGYRLLPPKDCPETLYCLMLRCWSQDPQQRPGFREIVQLVDEFSRFPDRLNFCPTYMSIPSNRRSVAVPSPLYSARSSSTSYCSEDVLSPPSPPSRTSSTITVGDWLCLLHMDMYVHMLDGAGIRDLADLMTLTPDDLLSLGVANAYHRQVIIDSFERIIETADTVSRHRACSRSRQSKDRRRRSSRSSSASRDACSTCRVGSAISSSGQSSSRNLSGDDLIGQNENSNSQSPCARDFVDANQNIHPLTCKTPPTISTAITGQQKPCGLGDSGYFV